MLGEGGAAITPRPLCSAEGVPSDLVRLLRVTADDGRGGRRRPVNLLGAICVEIPSMAVWQTDQEQPFRKEMRDSVASARSAFLAASSLVAIFPDPSIAMHAGAGPRDI